MTRRQALKERLVGEYNRFIALGMGQYEAYDKLLDLNIQVKDVMSFDTLMDMVRHPIKKPKK